MDCITEYAMQEVALEGSVGITQSKLWEILIKRTGSPVDELIRKAVWARLCAKSEISVFMLSKLEGGNEEWFAIFFSPLISLYSLDLSQKQNKKKTGSRFKIL